MLRIFLAHAKEDEDPVIALYDRLKHNGYQPWVDAKDLLPGQNWRKEISKAIKDSHVFLACLSHRSVAKEGYVQKEFKMALNEYARKPPGSIYLIPVCLDTCTMPELSQPEYGINLRDIHWVNLFEVDGFKKLMDALGSGFPEIHQEQLTSSISVVQKDLATDPKNLIQESAEVLKVDSLEKVSEKLVTDPSDEISSNDFFFSDFFSIAFICAAPIILMCQFIGVKAFLSWTIFGLGVGAVARAVYPGYQGLGILGTVGLGLSGAGIMTLFFSSIGLSGIIGLNAAGATISVLGAVLVLFTYYACTKRVA